MKKGPKPSEFKYAKWCTAAWRKQQNREKIPNQDMNKKQTIVILSCGLNLLHDFMHELKPIKPIFSLILLLYGKEIKKIKYPK